MFKAEQLPQNWFKPKNQCTFNKVTNKTNIFLSSLPVVGLDFLHLPYLFNTILKCSFATSDGPARRLSPGGGLKVC